MKILFVCEYNACRSQMAEGIARHLLPKTVEVKSAGLYPGEVNTLTMEVMSEIGIDISDHQSKLLKTIENEHFDYVVVLAEPAVLATQYLNSAHQLSWFYPDPVKTKGPPEAIKSAIRHVRDSLITKIKEYFLK